ncbi:MAG: YybS family protein [Desulfobulbaceae bacterium]
MLVFYYLCRYGSQAGGKYLLQGTLIALLAGVILQMASQVMLALILFPTGFILARSVVQGNAPALAGLKGVVVLSVSLFLFSGMIAITEGNHPYSMLLQSVNQGIDEALKYYQENEQIPAESYYLLAQTFLEIKERLSQLMPAILASLAMITVWLAMVFGNRMLQKNSGQRPWPEYQFWQLPEKLVWLVVAAAILALMPLPMARTIGFNLLVIASLIYCFQGLSIFLFFLNKWKVPLFIRSLLYVIVVFQSLGTIFLSVIGLADVWFDLRHLSSQDPDQKDTL